MTIDEIIETAIYEEVRRSFDGFDMNLIAVLRLQWKRCTPGVDELKHGLTYEDASSHIYIDTDLLVVSNFEEISIMSDAFLYRESILQNLGSSPSAVPDSFNDYSSERLHLDQDIPFDVVEHLIVNLKSDDDTLIRLVSNQPDPDLFIKNIKNTAIKKLIYKRWVVEQDNWV